MSLRNLICLHSTYFLSSTTTSAVTRTSAMHELNCMIVFENMDRFQSNDNESLLFKDYSTLGVRYRGLQARVYKQETRNFTLQLFLSWKVFPAKLSFQSPRRSKL